MSPFYNIMSSLHYIMSPSQDIVLPLHDVMSPFRIRVGVLTCWRVGVFGVGSCEKGTRL